MIFNGKWYPYLLRHDQGKYLQGTVARVGSSSAPQTPVASEGRAYHREDISVSPSENLDRTTQDTSFEGSPKRTPPPSSRSLNEAYSVREQTQLGRSSKKTPPVPPKKKYRTSPLTEHTPSRESPSGTTPISTGRTTHGYSPQIREHFTFDTTPRRTPPNSPRRITKTLQLTESTLFKLSNEIPHTKIQSLGFSLGCTHVQIARYKATNTRVSSVSYNGTNDMLQEWFQRTGLYQAHMILGQALIEADLLQLKDKYCGIWEIEKLFDIKWK